MLQEINDQELKELASVYDDQDTFVSLYLDLTHGINWKFISRRETQCTSVLKADKYLLGAFQKNMDMVKDYLKRDFNKEAVGKKYRGLALFFSKTMQYSKAYGIPLAVKNSMVIDTSPYIRPLAEIIDDWENYALILMDNQEVELFEVSLGAVKEHKRLGAHIMNKHKKGGWSQMRFSRLRKEAIDQFQKKVLEAFEKLIEESNIVGIVLAGPGEAKIHFKKRLPQKLAKKVMSVIDYDMDKPTEEIVGAATDEVAKKEREQDAQYVERLRSEILRGGPAVYGIKDTVEATREGKALQLILSKKLKPRGWICEHCQVVEVGVQKTCPYCNNKTSEVDVLEEILEFASRAGTIVEFVDDNPMLEDLGGVGAILRY